jgi:hypothetical protein
LKNDENLTGMGNGLPPLVPPWANAINKLWFWRAVKSFLAPPFESCSAISWFFDSVAKNKIYFKIH